MSDTQFHEMAEAMSTLTPEVRAIYGAHLLFWSLQDRIEKFGTYDGLTKPECRLLLGLGTPQRLGELANRIKVLPSSMTALADSLQKKGFATRLPDPADRRASLLHLTDAGKRRRDELSNGAAQVLNLATGLDSQDLEQLINLMTRIGTHVLNTGLPEGMKE